MTEHVLNLNTDIDCGEDTRVAPARHLTKRSSVLTLGISALVHVIVITLIIKISLNKAQEKNQTDQDIKPISARLYFPPTPPPASLENEMVPETPTVSETEQIEPNVEEIQEAALEQSLPEVATQPPKPVEEPTAIPQENVAEENTTQETSKYSTSQRLRNALNSHLNALEQQKMSNMVEGLSRSREQTMYQQSLERYKAPAPEPEMKTKKIDCSSTAGEIAGLLSGLAGGNLKCTDTPNFQKYIDARLNKSP